MELPDKLAILADAAKYDASCSSSGAQRGSRAGMIGNTSSSIAGCCHSFSADGRCISLLKVLMTNYCVYDCKYCVNRRSNDTRRAAFSPRELAELTIEFYRRNYIEGLFLSSGVLQSPDYTTERMIRTLRILREEYRFNGYIHAKAIPGTSPELVRQLGFLADRMSVNIELPSQEGLAALAPDKTKPAILRPMGMIRDSVQQNKQELATYHHAPSFAPAGQSTQLIVGATKDNDRHILQLTQSLYDRYRLKRVFYSAYVPVVENALLPALHNLKGFVRFSDYDGILGGEIEPKNRVLPFLRHHFCSRNLGQPFFLYDRTHGELLVYDGSCSRILQMEALELAPPNESEAQYRALWKKFFETIAIRERANPKCQNSFLPKRYRGNMTEFLPQSPTPHPASPAGALRPCVPGEIPAPVKHPESEPSAPASSI